MFVFSSISVYVWTTSTGSPNEIRPLSTVYGDFRVLLVVGCSQMTESGNVILTQTSRGDPSGQNNPNWVESAFLTSSICISIDAAGSTGSWFVTCCPPVISSMNVFSISKISLSLVGFLPDNTRPSFVKDFIFISLFSTTAPLSLG